MEAILKKKTFSANTERVYASIVKRLTKLDFKFPDKKIEKLDYLKEFFEKNKLEKASTRLDILNVIIVLRGIEELPVDKLKEYRGQLFQERLNNNVEKLKSLKETLMSATEYREELLKAFEAGEWKKFIVGYLMMTYGVRNKDVDVEIVKDKKDMTDPKQNYIFVRGKKATWVRNDYKTIKKYGVKTEVITDDEFLKAVKAHGVGRLFQVGKLNYNLPKLLINKMLESKVFKMVIDEAYMAKNTEEINRLSKSRGTSIATIKGFYDLNATDDVIKELV